MPYFMEHDTSAYLPILRERRGVVPSACHHLDLGVVELLHNVGDSAGLAGPTCLTMVVMAPRPNTDPPSRHA